LEELSAVEFDVQGDDVHAFSPSSYPSLRALHLELYRKAPRHSERLLAFFPLLDSLSCDNTDIDSPGSTMSTLASAQNVLLSIDPYELNSLGKAARSAKHLRVNKYPLNQRHVLECRPDNFFEGIETLSRFGRRLRLRLSPALQHLRTLILPREYAPDSPELWTRSAMASELILDLNHVGVEVVFEASPHPHLDSLVSPEFRKRCKALREAEEEQRLLETAQ
jgi:hypothetical protein